MTDEHIWKGNESRDKSRQVNGPVNKLTSHNPQASAHVSAPVNLTIHFNGSPSSGSANRNGPSIQVTGTPQDYLQPLDNGSSKSTPQIPISDVVNTIKVDIDEQSGGRVVGKPGPQLASALPSRATSLCAEGINSSPKVNANDSSIGNPLYKKHVRKSWDIHSQLQDVKIELQDDMEKLMLSNEEKQDLEKALSQLRKGNDQQAETITWLCKGREQSEGELVDLHYDIAISTEKAIYA